MTKPTNSTCNDLYKNTLRTKRLVAPIAFNTPMVEVRSMIKISSILTTVMPATNSINAMISHTLVSSNANQSKICVLVSRAVKEVNSTGKLKYKASLTVSVISGLSTYTSTFPVALSGHSFNLLI